MCLHISPELIDHCCRIALARSVQKHLGPIFLRKKLRACLTRDCSTFRRQLCSVFGLVTIMINF